MVGLRIFFVNVCLVVDQSMVVVVVVSFRLLVIIKEVEWLINFIVFMVSSFFIFYVVVMQMIKVVFFYWMIIFVKFQVLEFVIMEWVYIVVISIYQVGSGKWMVKVLYLFVYVISYVVQIKVVWQVSMYRCSRISVIV